MVAETDGGEERTNESKEKPPANNTLIGWLGAIHAELRAMRVEMRYEFQATRAEFRQERQARRTELREESQTMRVEFREETRETRREISSRADRVEQRGEGRDGSVDESVACVKGGVDAERKRKNRVIIWLGIGVVLLFDVCGLILGIINLLT